LSKDLGDFQTPPSLVEQVLNCPELAGKTWSRLLEPTCGRGNFIRPFCQLGNANIEIHAIEIQQQYAAHLQQLPKPITLHQTSIFSLNLKTDLQWLTNGPLLIVGNPPWVTTAKLGTLESHNHPAKTNLKHLRGLDALTGSSNFDIAEHIILKLIWELADQQPTIALLCKTSVARNILHFAPQAKLPIAVSVIRQLDAKRWFNAAVDACLLYLQLAPNQYNSRTIVYADLQTTEPLQVIEHKQGHLIADVATYEKLSFLEGECTRFWRQGLKHDAASVMELSLGPDGHWQNKAQQPVVIEPDYIYPLLKSADLAHEPMGKPRKAVIVTQKRLTDDTRDLRMIAPLLWKYLSDHNSVFAKRKSSIYADKPPFSIFGIGDYAFAPYKVAIAGMSKTPRFQAIGPIQLQPVMCDDTCYFVACWSAEQAALLATLLNAQICLDFIRATIFTDSKRPITKKLLQRISLQALLDHITPAKAIADAAVILPRLKQGEPAHWPPAPETLLYETTASPHEAGQAQLQLGFWKN
jgi:16S rRNA A1518/A1519 N6-dimethyltransferase RsmA/KsgA/DIM1 with predicted DNA glycosylase/AP lyase activity